MRLNYPSCQTGSPLVLGRRQGLHFSARVVRCFIEAIFEHSHGPRSSSMLYGLGDTDLTNSSVGNFLPKSTGVANPTPRKMNLRVSAQPQRGKRIRSYPDCAPPAAARSSDSIKPSHNRKDPPESAVCHTASDRAFSGRMRQEKEILWLSGCSQCQVQEKVWGIPSRRRPRLGAHWHWYLAPDCRLVLLLFSSTATLQ